MNIHALQIILGSVAVGMTPVGAFAFLLLVISSGYDPSNYEDRQLRRMRQRERKKFWIALQVYGALIILLAATVAALAVWIHYTN